MIEIQNRGSDPRLDFDTDPNGNLIYWDCVNNAYPIPEPAKRIDDPYLAIGKVGQQNILPNHLRLRTHDLQSTYVTTAAGVVVGEPVPPGLSGFIFFGRHHIEDKSFKDMAKEILNKSVHRKTRIHIAQVGDIMEAGWTVYYAPLIDQTVEYPVYSPLHVVMTPNSILSDIGINDATETERIALAKVFVRWDS